MMLDPVSVAYSQYGQPLLPAGNHAAGTCCRCGQHSPLLPVAAVVSAKFTGYDTLGPGQGFCQVCAWSHSATARKFTMGINRTTARVLDAAALFDALLAHDHSTAIVVPISGRKHVLPHAQWGTIRVDDINLAWRPPDTIRLQALADLRRRGAPTRALSEATPTWAWLKTQPKTTWSSTQQQWELLAPWRSTPYLALAMKATTAQKGSTR